MAKETPMLSLKERDRRWALVRKFMKEEGLDCLVVPGLQNREAWDAYLSYEPAQGVVILPLEGEPTYLTWHGSKVGRHVENYTNRGIVPWIEDWRVGGFAKDWVNVIKEKGYESGTLGIVGLSTINPFALEGYFNYKTYVYMLENLPKAKFVDVSRPFVELVASTPHSEEELAMLRHSAYIGELACKAMVDLVKPGVSENEIYATITGTIYRNGAMPLFPPFRAGPALVGAGYPLWLGQGQTHPYLIKKGDVVAAEIFVIYGGVETQQQMTVAVKPVSDISKKCAEVARASFEAGLKMCYPGKTFKDVVEAMEVVVVEGGCWHMGTLIHTMPIGAGGGRLDVGAEAWAKRHNIKAVGYDYPRKWDWELKPGLSLQLEPNACLDDQRIQIGCNVVITEGEPEVMNKLPTEMRVIG